MEHTTNNEEKVYPTAEELRENAINDINEVYNYVEDININDLSNAVSNHLLPGISDGLTAVSKFLETPEAKTTLNDSIGLIHKMALAIVPAMRQLSTEISTAMFNYVDNVEKLDENDEISDLGDQLEKNFDSYGKLLKKKTFLAKNPAMSLSAKRCANHLEKFGDYLETLKPESNDTEDKEMSTSTS